MTDGTLTNAGTVNASNAGNALHHVTATNSGTLNVLAGAVLLIDADGSLNNSGDFNVTGTAEIDDTAVTNTGTTRRAGRRHADPRQHHHGQQRRRRHHRRGTGILNLNNAAIDQDDGVGANPGTLTVSATGTLNLQGIGPLTDGTLTNAGTVNASNAGNALHNVDATNTGTIDVLAGGALLIDADGSLNNSGDFNVTGTAEFDDTAVTNTGTLDVLAGGYADAGQHHHAQQRCRRHHRRGTGILNLNNAAIDQDDSVGANPGTLAVSATGTLNLQGSGQLTDGTLTNAGTVNASNAGNALHHVTATNSGTLNVLAGAVLLIDADGSLNNSGDFNVTGTAEIDDTAVTNTGTLDVLAGGSLDAGQHHHGQQRCRRHHRRGNRHPQSQQRRDRPG